MLFLFSFHFPYILARFWLVYAVLFKIVFTFLPLNIRILSFSIFCINLCYYYYILPYSSGCLIHEQNSIYLFTYGLRLIIIKKYRSWHSILQIHRHNWLVLCIDRRLFIDGSKTSLEAILLYNDNKFPLNTSRFFKSVERDDNMKLIPKLLCTNPNITLLCDLVFKEDFPNTAAVFLFWGTV